jgi:ATPase family associated with various cellular activities (AAA)
MEYSLAARTWTRPNVSNWIGRAAAALVELYSSESGEFWRDSKRTIHGGLSSNRAFLALAECQNRLIERDHGRDKHPIRGAPGVDEIVAEIIVKFYTREYEPGQEKYLSHNDDRSVHPYSMAHAILSLTAAIDVDSRGEPKAGNAVLHSRVHDLALELVRILLEDAKTEAPSRRIAHPLVRLQVSRAIDAVISVWIPPITVLGGLRSENAFLTDLALDEARRRGFTLNSKVDEGARSLREAQTAQVRAEARESVVRHLGLHSGRDPEFDAGSLLAALCTLQRFGGRSGRQLITRGLDVIASTQDDDGSWRADLIPLDDDRPVYVSSLEMAILVGNILIADLETGSIEFVDAATSILSKCFRLFEAGYIDISSDTDRNPVAIRGWANDRLRQASVAETWTTSLALQFVLRLDLIGEMLEQRETLQFFRFGEIQYSRLRWPDLKGILPDPMRSDGVIREILGRTLERASDPTSGRALTTSIARDIVGPILASRNQHPGEVASLLLYGPPGTRKTSLVRQIAQALGWPLVEVSPSDFLLDGIEGIERRAQQIFDGLEVLKRAVVVFDECEELIRRRLPIELPESRTQGAFITAGMLPRLQRLRDNSWCVFAIVTNIELEELDPAVVRRGRLDRRIEVPNPTIDAQEEYLRASLRDMRMLRDPNLVTANAVHDSELEAIRRALEAFQSVDLDEAERSIRSSRSNAERYRRTGELRTYIKELQKIKVVESDLPLLTFAVLDDVLKQLASKPTLEQHQVLGAIRAAALSIDQR